jgi:hypothetical protein
MCGDDILSVLILLYMCPHTTTVAYVSSYSYICVGVCVGMIVP